MRWTAGTQTWKTPMMLPQFINARISHAWKELINSLIGPFSMNTENL